MQQYLFHTMKALINLISCFTYSKLTKSPRKLKGLLGGDITRAISSRYHWLDKGSRRTLRNERVDNAGACGRREESGCTCARAPALPYVTQRYNVLQLRLRAPFLKASNTSSKHINPLSCVSPNLNSFGP